MVRHLSFGRLLGFFQLGALSLAAATTPSSALAYGHFVVAPDVVVRYAGETLRFCPRANLKGLICRQPVKVFGKTYEEVIDWWHPETYVMAVTGLKNIEVTEIDLTRDERGLVIRFRPVD